MSSFVLKTEPRGSKKKPPVIVVGGRVSKKAVKRNLLKRRIKAILQPIAGKSERNLIVIVKPEAAEKTYQELKEEIETKIRELI